MSALELPLLERLRYPPLGRCMYCDLREGRLTTEHIIPAGLDGTLELPESSCEACAAITGRLERSLLRGEMWALRLFLDMSSRRKHKQAPTHFPVEITRGGQAVTEMVPREEYAVVQQFPLFAAPRALIGAASREGIDVEGHQPIVFGDPHQMLQRLRGEALSITTQIRPVPFGQLIAKVALGMAEATGASKLLAAPSPVRGVILGTNPAVGDYVGTITAPLEGHPGQVHRVLVYPDEQRGWLIGDVQLFAASPTPRYGVLLGRLRGS